MNRIEDADLEFIERMIERTANRVAAAWVDKRIDDRDYHDLMNPLVAVKTKIFLIRRRDSV